MKKTIIVVAIAGLASLSIPFFVNIPKDFASLCFFITLMMIVLVAVLAISFISHFENSFIAKSKELIDLKIMKAANIQEVRPLLEELLLLTKDYSEINVFKNTSISILANVYSRSEDLNSFCQKLSIDKKHANGDLWNIFKAAILSEQVIMAYRKLFSSEVKRVIEQRNLSSATIILELSKDGVLKYFKPFEEDFTEELAELKKIKAEAA